MNFKCRNRFYFSVLFWTDVGWFSIITFKKIKRTLHWLKVHQNNPYCLPFKSSSALTYNCKVSFRRNTVSIKLLPLRHFIVFCQFDSPWSFLTLYPYWIFKKKKPVTHVLVQLYWNIRVPRYTVFCFRYWKILVLFKPKISLDKGEKGKTI